MSGYVECACCSTVIIGEPGDLCACCEEAVCADYEVEDGDGSYFDCQVPRCLECDTPASFMNDKRWHSNCENGCENEGKAWS